MSIPDSNILTVDQINEFYLEFERLFYRIERSQTYYQVLGIERSADSEEIKSAYQEAIAALKPFYSGLFQPMPLDAQVKAKRVLKKISEAFTVLSNLGKRVEYDSRIFRKSPTRIPFELPDFFMDGLASLGHPGRRDDRTTSQEAAEVLMPFVAADRERGEATVTRPSDEGERPDAGDAPAASQEEHKTAEQGNGAVTDLAKEIAKEIAKEASSQATETGQESESHSQADIDINIKIVNGRCIVQTQSGTGTAKTNRRRFERHPITLLAQVIGYDRINGKWEEIAETVDVSRRGMALRLRARLRHESVLYVQLPLPLQFRSHGFAESTYNVYAVVRRIGPIVDGFRTVGVEFIGETPPPGYAEKPWAVFKVDTWNGPDRRREPRVDRSEVVSIRYLNEALSVLRQEVAVTENVSPGGARVFVKAAPSDVELVRITNLTHSFESLAAICNRYIGSDGFERVCLRFLDNKWAI